MKFIPYTNDKSSKLLEMMKEHIDLTPELETTENKVANYDFVCEICSKKQSGELSYLLTSEDEERMFGYMSVDKRYDSRQKIYMCITALFIKQNNEVADNARAMLKHFTCLLCDTKGICVNIHPSMISAIHFWMENGFVQAPEMSNYVNAEDQRLIAYWKTLRYNETREN